MIFEYLIFASTLQYGFPLQSLKEFTPAAIQFPFIDKQNISAVHNQIEIVQNVQSFLPFLITIETVIYPRLFQAGI